MCIRDSTDMSFAFFKMPYRVDHCTGQFKLVDSHLDFSIHSTIHQHPASLTGFADNIGIGSPTFRANLDVPGNVPIDENYSSLVMLIRRFQKSSGLSTQVAL